KTAGVRGPASSRRQHQTATEELVTTMIFQNRCWVFGPGIEFTGKGGEEPLSLSGEERAGRLLLSAQRFAARVPGLRGPRSAANRLGSGIATRPLFLAPPARGSRSAG